MKLNRRRAGVLLCAVGLASAIAASGLWLYNRQSERAAGDASLRVADALLEGMIIGSLADGEAAGQPLPAALPAAGSGEADGAEYLVIDNAAYIGMVNIPAFGLSLPVNSDWSYDALKRTPCRYSGEIGGDSFVVVAHNYKTHFGRIAELAIGDAVTTTDIHGNYLEYRVALVEDVNEAATDSVVNSGYPLTLFTCTYSGEARTVVRCEKAPEAATATA